MSVFDKMEDGKSKVDLAVARIKTFCTGKKAFVAFSGGKDSQCCYHLARQAGIPFDAIYSITRFEPVQLLRFIRGNYPDAIFRRAYKRSLVEDVTSAGLPSRWARWCCDAKHKKQEGYEIAIIGVRAEESSRRAANWRTFGYKQDRTAYVCPIFDWTAEEVWEYLNGIGVPHCELYDPPYSFRRIGCVCCPLAPKLMKREAELWPKTAAVLKEGARRYVERMRGRNWITARGKTCGDWRLADDPLEELWHRWITSGQTTMSLEAYAESRKRKKVEDAPCLFAGTGFSESDEGKGDETSEV